MAPVHSGSGDFLAGAWREQFEAQRLADFERLWRLELAPLDRANTTRGGVSAVGVLVLAAHGREGRRLVVKRQRNHQTRTWRHPLKGIPTARKEFDNIRRFERCGLASAAPVFFGQRQDHRGTRAILITEFLEGYQSLENLLAQWTRHPNPRETAKDAILRQTADLIARMHRAGFRHNCLYPKHLFVNTADVHPDIRLIDLEKAARTFRGDRCMTRDLGAFFRHSPHWSAADQARFLVDYFGSAHMTPRIERTWRRILRGMARKRRRDSP
jgi:tRNA A-37 threonylcarbamoyl transferase component Bud32